MTREGNEARTGGAANSGAVKAGQGRTLSGPAKSAPRPPRPRPFYPHRFKLELVWRGGRLKMALTAMNEEHARERFIALTGLSPRHKSRIKVTKIPTYQGLRSQEQQEQGQNAIMPTGVLA